MYYAPEFEAVAGTYMALPVSERAGYVEERKKVVGRLHEVGLCPLSFTLGFDRVCAHTREKGVKATRR